MMNERIMINERVDSYAQAFAFPERDFYTEFPRSSSFQRHVEEQILRCEEAVIKEILKALLHREPMPEDVKKVTIASNINWNNKYQIAFENRVLGWITKEFIRHEYFVKFTPII